MPPPPPNKRKNSTKQTKPQNEWGWKNFLLSVVKFARISSNSSPSSPYFWYVWSVIVYVLSSPSLDKLPGFFNSWPFIWDYLLYFSVELRRSLICLFRRAGVGSFIRSSNTVVFEQPVGCLQSNLLFGPLLLGFVHLFWLLVPSLCHMPSKNWVSSCWIYWHSPSFFQC